MTLADQLREEGLQEGLQEGRQEGLQEGIVEALEIRFGQIPEGLRDAVAGHHDLTRMVQG